MGKSLFNGAITYVVAFLTLVTVSSCVDEKFELAKDKLDLNVTVFQEGISIPLGSTEKIVLESLYEQLDSATRAMLQNIDGAYMFSMADTLDVTKDLTEALQGMGALDSVALTKSFSFPLKNIDLSSIKIKGQELTMEEIDLEKMLAELDVEKLNENLPNIEKALETIKVSVPDIESDALSINFMEEMADDFQKQTVIASLSNSLNVPESALSNPLASQEMDYDSIVRSFSYFPNISFPTLQTAYVFDPYEVEVPISFSLPKEIKSVKEIQLNEDASFELVFQILNPLFTSGSIVPELDIDLHELLHIDEIRSGYADGGMLEEVELGGDRFAQHVKDKFVMSKDNKWTADHVYHVDALALSTDDWEFNEETGCLELNKTMKLTMGGQLVVNDLKTTLVHLVEHGETPMEIKMQLLFNDFEIHDVKMEINPISPEIEPIEVPVELKEIDLGTDLVEKIEYIEFDKESPLQLYAKAVLPSMFEGIDVMLKSLKVEFPEGLVIDDSNSVGKYDALTSTLTYENVSLTKGLDDHVVIDRMNLPALENNKLSYSGMIKVTAEAAAEGILSSYNLINNPNEDVTVDVRVACQPKLSDYSVVIRDYEYDVDFKKIDINEKIDKEIADFMMDEPIMVSLKKDENGNNPKIYIHLTYPNDPAIQIKGKKGDGLKIDLPDMLRFNKSSIAQSYNFNFDDNTMTFTENDDIPTDITLELENIAVQAEKVEGEAEGKETYFVRDYMEVTGGVRLVGTTIHNTDVERIKENPVKVVSMNGNIPDIEPAEFGLNEYEKTIEESFKIDNIEVEVPDMIKSIELQDLLLKDVYLDLNVDASSIKEVVGEVDLDLSLEVALPKMFRIEGESEGVTYENNVLRINRKLDKDGKIVVDGVNIVGFDLSDLEVKDGKLAIEIGEIPVKGTVKIKNLTVDLDKLNDKELSVKIDGGLASRGEDGKPSESILIDKITGYVGMEIDPVNTAIDLSSVAETLNSENMSFSLDIFTFYLTLDLKTNIDIPLKGAIEITPYFGPDPGKIESRELVLDPQARKDDCYNIFISNMNPANPAPESGYDGRYDAYKDYQCIDLDLISMLYKKEEGQKPVMADSIKVSVNAGVDSKKICTIEPNKDYSLVAEYAVGVPIELGEDFAFEYRTKIEDLPEVASQVFGYASVGLGGKVTNCLPLNLNLQVIPLDSNGNEIPLKDNVGVLKISSCDAKGNPVTTKLDFVLSGKGTDLSDMKAVELVFTADAKGAAGAPLKADGFIQVQLSARVPDGVTLDLGEFLFNEDEDGEDYEDNQQYEN